MRVKTLKNRKALSTLSVEELQQRLVNQSVYIVIATFAMVGTVFFFGPKVGYLFSFISKYRYANQTDNRAPNTPNFYNVIKATNQRNIDLKGYAEPGTTVAIYVNGPEKGTAITDNEGVFTFSALELNEGRNTIFARAVDSDGNESEKSQTVNIDYDTKTPDIELESPKKDETVRNLEGRVLVKGKLSEKASVKVNGNTAVVKGDNTFEILIGAEAGEMEITIEATDEAGNKKEEKVEIKYVKTSA